MNIVDFCQCHTFHCNEYQQILNLRHGFVEFIKLKNRTLLVAVAADYLNHNKYVRVTAADSGLIAADADDVNDNIDGYADTAVLCHRTIVHAMMDAIKAMVPIAYQPSIDSIQPIRLIDVALTLPMLKIHVLRLKLQADRNMTCFALVYAK